MANVTVAPYGAWASPVSATTITRQGLRLGPVAIDGSDIYWLEGRPAEGGRDVLVRRRADGATADMVPADHNVRTRVHEYGGGAFVVDAGVVFYQNFADQRIYRTDGHTPPVPLTPAGSWRYADAVVDRRRARLIVVREDHSGAGREPVNALVAVSVRGDGTFDPGTVLVEGADFYSTPRLSADGTRLCWLSWSHPNMPWDGTELWVADVSPDGRLAVPTKVAGGREESIYQPDWWPDGTLCFASDRTGWWLLYRWRDAQTEPVLRDAPPSTEFGKPQWLFGTATWASAGAGRLVVSFTSRGRWRLGVVDTAAGTLAPLDEELEPSDWLAASADGCVVATGSPAQATEVVKVTLATGGVTTLRVSSAGVIHHDDISEPEFIEFPTSGGRTAFALYYPPRNGAFCGPAGERPPLLVISHGGPTSAAERRLALSKQFWTTRGFAIVDVDYGGSTGYGRAYRQRLNGQWGVVDVEDCIHAARFLVEQGKADARRLIIRGASAGGYTTLAALTFHPEVFAAGASYFGVSDAEALAADTHKFEARYCDSLIGPYPEARDLYRARSPIHFVDRMACPVIFLQGLEDRVVPPSQSERMAEAVRAKGLMVEYVPFPGEQHGFRAEASIVRAMESELAFYGRVFGFSPAPSRIAP